MRGAGLEGVGLKMGWSGSLSASVRIVGVALVFSGCATDPGGGLRVVLCGDSTMSPYATESGIVGWGEVLSGFLDPGAVLFNHAVSGATAESFLREGLSGALAANADIAVIQFGHNENDSLREARAVDSLVSAFRARRTRAILVTPMESRDGSAGFGNLAAGIRQAGDRLDLPVVPLDSLSHLAWSAAGPDSTRLFFYDHIHLNGAGATRIAALVAGWILRLEPELQP